MKNIDVLMRKAKKCYHEVKNVTLTYSDGSTREMSTFDAILAIMDIQEGDSRFIETDQPPGSLIHVLTCSTVPLDELYNDIEELSDTSHLFQSM